MRNDKGDYDPNGLYANAPKICNHKYVNEVCMAYGVATVEDKDGKVEGVCMYPFNYSGKWLCSEEEIEGHCLLAIRAHRASMGRQSKAWYESNRIDGAYYLEEGVENVKGIGKKANLLKACGIKTVNDLRVLAADDKKRKDVIRSIKGLGEATMQKLLVETNNTLIGPPP